MDDLLRCTGKNYRKGQENVRTCSRGVWGVSLTLVVDGVPGQEDQKDRGDDGRAGGVFAIEVAGLDPRRRRGSGGTLGKLRVEVHNVRHARARSAGLKVRREKHCLAGPKP